jgi:flagellar capping protein FliD
MGSSASSITVPTFTGESTFASSFQQVLSNAVNLASLPIQEIQANVNTQTNQESALSSLESTFQSLDSAVQAVDTASSGSLSATSSDPTSVSATTTADALPGTYTIQVDSPGSYSTAISQGGSPVVTDPTTQSISSATSFTLTVNGTTHGWLSRGTGRRDQQLLGGRAGHHHQRWFQHQPRLLPGGYQYFLERRPRRAFG